MRAGFLPCARSSRSPQPLLRRCTSYQSSRSTTWGSNDEKAELKRLFDIAGNFAKSKKVPVILGEFAVTKGETYKRTSAARTSWMTSVAQGARSRGMVPVLWDTGSDISRADGSFSPEFQSVVDNTN